MLESLSIVVHHDEDFESESDDEQEEYDETTTASTSENEKPKEKKIRTIVYDIRVDVPMMKCHKFHLIKDGEVILSAKRKGNKMVIGKGTEIHLKKCTINIVQRKRKTWYKLMTKVLLLIMWSLKILKQFQWAPRSCTMKPRLNPKKGGYCLKLGGDYHHSVVSSSKNSALQKFRR